MVKLHGGEDDGPTSSEAALQQNVAMYRKIAEEIYDGKPFDYESIANANGAQKTNQTVRGVYKAMVEWEREERVNPLDDEKTAYLLRDFLSYYGDASVAKKICGLSMLVAC